MDACPLPLHQQCMVPQLGQHLHQGRFPHSCLTLNDHWHTTLVSECMFKGERGISKGRRKGERWRGREEWQEKGNLAQQVDMYNKYMCTIANIAMPINILANMKTPTSANACATIASVLGPFSLFNSFSACVLL